ncbi:MAG TPA: hypothetical protein VHE81_02125, partial [Lacipirellulaceae bacterium]|nr:hypothetical protein [Lacipirellulaceae bacterium]
ATRDFLDEFEERSNIRTIQRRWFDALSKSMDAFMRSPLFLQGVKHNTDTAAKLKRQADDVMTEIARNANIPTAGDISGLFERLHSVEETILSRLARIEERLDAIEDKVEIGQSVGNQEAQAVS